jgi:hypothetical protein
MPSGSSIRISVRPQGSAAGSRTTGTPAAASRACPARTSRTWTQIITERPGGPAACPETSSDPWPRKMGDLSVASVAADAGDCPGRQEETASQRRAPHLQKSLRTEGIQRSFPRKGSYFRQLRNNPIAK